MGLDNKLKIGRQQARHFFDGQFDIRKNKEAIISRERRHLKPRAWWKTCLAGAGVVAAAAVCAVIIMAAGNTPEQTAQQTDAGLAEQTVYLNEDMAYRMNAIPVDMPDADAGLITVLWEMGGADEPMAYYSLFEACDTIYPALTIPFPESDYDMLLIASGDSEQGSLGYRLIGYSGNALTTWWSEDRVPGGRVTLSDGVAVERRTQGSGDDIAVTYIVPIQSTAPGSIALPVDTLRMCVGEQILLIGAHGADTTTRSGLLGAQEHEVHGVSAVLLQALRAGTDVVSVGPVEDASTLSVDIGE